MKKTAQSILIVTFIASILFVLTGCGNKKTNKSSSNESSQGNSDTLVATKTENDEYFGETKTTMEISFKDDKTEKAVITMEFSNEETAKGIKALLDLASQGADTEGLETIQEGNKLIMKMNASEFADQEKLDGELSKDNIRKVLEEQGYSIQ